MTSNEIPVTPVTIAECFTIAVEAAREFGRHPVFVSYQLRQYGQGSNDAVYSVSIWGTANGTAIGQCHNADFYKALDGAMREARELTTTKVACEICGGKNYNEFKHTHPAPTIREQVIEVVARRLLATGEAGRG